MASKKYIYRVTNRTPRARSKRLREIGSGSSATTIIMNGSSVSGGSGADGFSPTISFEVEGSVLTVRVVDKTGIKEYEIDLGESTGVDALREEFEECCAEVSRQIANIKDMLGVVTFTIVPTPADAKVTINGKEASSVEVFAGTTVSWRVEADGYITRTGTETVTEDTEIEVVLADIGSLISSFTYDDIPAGGGPVLPKVEAVEGASFTYSGAGVDADTGEVSADSLGTTLKDRTRITTVTVTAEVNGSTATATCDVYQQANVIERSDPVSTLYGIPRITGGHTYKDISAAGGTVTPTAPTYAQDVTTTYEDTYTSGATGTHDEDSDITTGATVAYYGDGVDEATGAVSGDYLGTTVKARTKITTSIVEVTMNGVFGTASCDVYQAENKVESESEETTYGTPSVSLSYAEDIPAGGGSVRPTLSYSQTKTTGHSYTYSSGAVDSPEGTTETITSGADVTYSGSGVTTSTGSVGASSLGTTVKARTKITTATATVTMNGKTNSAAADVYQEANEVTATETSVTYGDVEVLEFWYEDVPASGGTVYPNVSYRQMSYDTVKNTYTSGGTETSSTERGYITDGAEFSYSGQWNTGAVTGENLGTTPKDRTSLGIVYMSVTLNGVRAAVECEVYQQENRVEDTTHQFIGESLEFRTFEYADDIPAEGGTIYPTVEVRYIYEYRNGYVYTSGSVEWDTDSREATSVTPDSVVYSTRRLLTSITIDAATGAATAATSTSPERQSLTTVTAAASYTSPETGEELTATATAEVWQEARETYLTVAPTTATVNASGGSVAVEVSSSSDWSATSNASWLSVSASLLSVLINVSSNSTTSERTGTVTFTNEDGLTAVLTVTQEGYTGSSTHTLTINLLTDVSARLTLTVDGANYGSFTIDGSTPYVGEFAHGAVVGWSITNALGYNNASGEVTMTSDQTVNVSLMMPATT